MAFGVDACEDEGGDEGEDGGASDARDDACVDARAGDSVNNAARGSATDAAHAATTVAVTTATGTAPRGSTQVGDISATIPPEALASEVTSQILQDVSEETPAAPVRDRRATRDAVASLGLAGLIVAGVAMGLDRGTATTSPAAVEPGDETAAVGASGRAAKIDPAAFPRPLPEKTSRFANHWAYLPIGHPRAPSVANADWPRNEIDAFILARLEREGLEPAPEADRRTLLRRAYLDLIGVPPSAEEVEAFVRDRRPDAYERRLEALLASPMYGERWGRHWLDVARYADSNGVDENIAYANAFRYRDYVIDAFNRDIPFDEFLIDQIAGDLIPEPANPTADDDHRTRSRIAALGFLALGPKMLAEPDKEKERVDVVDEQIDVVTKAFLGQTVSCARCHDHKFDPVSQADYFALSGVFRSVSTFDNIATVGRVAQRPLATAAEVKRSEEWRALAKELDEARDRARESLRSLERRRNAARWAEALAAPAGMTIVVADGAVPRANPLGDALAAAARDVAAPVAEREAFRSARAARDAHEKSRPADLPRTLVVKEAKVDETPLHDRGDHTQPKGDTIARAVPSVLERALPGPRFPADRSGRLELARWMADPENPLTARVAVNRLWTWHFGIGLVDTPSNFGVLGSAPSHPELLDHLARRFARERWSMKAMHRLIMTSATYRQSSATHEALPDFDPDNRLLSRFPRRRVEAEIIRDSVLAASGALDTTMGGTLLGAGDHDYVTNDQSGNSARYDSNRRSIYLPVIRNAMFGLFTAFDYPDASAPIDCRPRTVVAPQALFFMNAPFVETAAKRIAETLAATTRDSDQRVREAFRRTLARDPDVREHEESRDFLAGLERSGLASADALTRLCHALLSTNEFVTIE